MHDRQDQQTNSYSPSYKRYIFVLIIGISVVLIVILLFFASKVVYYNSVKDNTRYTQSKFTDLSMSNDFLLLFVSQLDCSIGHPRFNFQHWLLWQLLCFTSVSYTHLDVYKRQHTISALLYTTYYQDCTR